MSTPGQKCSTCKKVDPECGFPPGKLTCNDCNTKRKKRRAANNQPKLEAKEEARQGKQPCAHGTWCPQADFKEGQKYCETHREYNRNRTAKRRACAQGLALPAELNHVSSDNGSNNGSTSSSDFTAGFSAELPQLDVQLNVTLAAPESHATFNSFEYAGEEALPDLPDIAEVDIDALINVNEETPHGDVSNTEAPVVDEAENNLADQFGQMTLTEDVLKGAILPKDICNDCGKKGPNMLRCSRCKEVWYCDAVCQRRAWKAHKKLCGSPAKVQPAATNSTADAVDPARMSIIEAAAEAELKRLRTKQMEDFETAWEELADCVAIVSANDRAQEDAVILDGQGSPASTSVVRYTHGMRVKVCFPFMPLADKVNHTIVAGGRTHEARIFERTSWRNRKVAAR